MWSEKRSKFCRSRLLVLVWLGCLACGGGSNDSGTPPEPFAGQVGTVMFVTQVPIGGLGSVVSTFANHFGDEESVLRGGDVMIRYPDGSLRNLTREAGFGEADMQQGPNAIAVREPCVHWDGNRALFSMVVGGASQQYERKPYRWQMYEVTGLAQGDTAVIVPVPGQPEGFNNVSAVYGSDDSILFASDRPRDGLMHHYPALDEYESMATTVGIYKLSKESGLELIEHSPSGVFGLSVDSFGRVLFTKWDHLQRDQQGDSESAASTYQPATHSDESVQAEVTTEIAGAEVFPEPRTTGDPGYNDAIEPHRFNQFFVWEVNQDGSGEETLNHVGRQEWGGSYTEGSVKGDSALRNRAPNLQRKNSFDLPDDGGAFHVRQDPTEPAWYVATSALEFATGSAGTLVLLEGDPSVNPEDMRVLPLTPYSSEASIPGDTGYFRNPMRLQDGSYWAVHTEAEGELDNRGSAASPDWNYTFRIKLLEKEGDRYRAGPTLTKGIERSVTWWTPDQAGAWSGTLWELDPVEVAPRPRPTARVSKLPSVEQAVFDELGVSPDALRSWLAERDLALLISRNVTARDRNDVQQPYRLTVPGGVSSAGSEDGYEIETIQFFQADYVRSYESRRGRRVLARPIHGADLQNNPEGPEGSVRIGLDGSMAAFVPARRALAWQLVAPDQTAVVRERNWISFGKGEIRVCAACHGVNKATHDGSGPPENPPLALRALLEEWKSRTK